MSVRPGTQLHSAAHSTDNFIILTIGCLLVTPIIVPTWIDRQGTMWWCAYISNDRVSLVVRKLHTSLLQYLSRGRVCRH
jgi:hypothetical protein